MLFCSSIRSRAVAEALDSEAEDMSALTSLHLAVTVANDASASLCEKKLSGDSSVELFFESDLKWLPLVS